MKASPFSVLPNEIVEHIFMFLDHRTLLKSALVNVRWSEIIGKSPRVVKKMKFRWPSSRNVEIWSSQVQRRYHMISFNNVEVWSVEELKKVGQNVKAVEFKNQSALDFFDIMNCFPKVEDITIENSSFSVQRKFKKPNLANLKSLKVRGCRDVS